jgi:probable phosphoglycerate mutase
MLILARHGNTFEKGETPRIVGAHEDLPLTAEGKDQARVLGRALKEAGIKLESVRAGPLSRTFLFAGIAAIEAGYSGEIVIDPRLRELDFGLWSGLTDDEVAAKFGQESIDAWRRDGKRPDDCAWTPSEAEVRANLAALAAETKDAATLCVTSNGVLRYAMELDPAAFVARGAKGGFRVKTGRLCAFRQTQDGLKLILWDEKPDSARLRTI